MKLRRAEIIKLVLDPPTLPSLLTPSCPSLELSEVISVLIHVHTNPGLYTKLYDQLINMYFYILVTITDVAAI